MNIEGCRHPIARIRAVLCLLVLLLAAGCATRTADPPSRPANSAPTFRQPDPLTGSEFGTIFGGTKER